MDDRLLRARTRAAKAVDKNKEERGYAPMSVNDMRDEGVLRDPDVVGRWRKPNESRSKFPKKGY